MTKLEGAENYSKSVGLDFKENLHCSDVSHSVKILKKSLQNGSLQNLSFFVGAINIWLLKEFNMGRKK